MIAQVYDWTLIVMGEKGGGYSYMLIDKRVKMIVAHNRIVHNYMIIGDNRSRLP